MADDVLRTRRMKDEKDLRFQILNPEIEYDTRNLFHPSSAVCEAHHQPCIPHPLKVALLGLGNVARAFVDYLNRTSTDHNPPVQIVALADSTGGIFVSSSDQVARALARKQSGASIENISPADLIRDAREFIARLPEAGAQFLVESLPTNLSSGQPALGLVEAALARGVHVVTVDKGPLVCGMDALKKAAIAAGTRLGFSGTTGVGIPEEIHSERVLEIRGVLNGTTNYILNEIEERGFSFDQALARAQADGIAEPDPSLDIEGWDTAAKILILAKDLMGARARIDEVSRIGIDSKIESLIETARSRYCRVRLVGRARIWQGRVRVSVAPKIVTIDSPLYSVSGTSKAAVFRVEGKDNLLAFAKSGRDAISQIVLDDILKIASLK